MFAGAVAATAVIAGARADARTGVGTPAATADGGLHLVSLGPGLVWPTGVLVASDGTAWFNTDGSGAIHLTADGRRVAYRQWSGAAFTPAWGPDGALWAIDLNHGGVIRMTVDGAVTRYRRLWGSGGEGPWPENIIAGPDGAMWFGDQLRGRLMSVRADGATRVTTTLSRRAMPEVLITGADGSVWFTDSEAHGLRRVRPDGRLDVVRFGDSEIPAGAVAPDGAVWFIRLVEDRWGYELKRTELIRVDARGQITRRRVPTYWYYHLAVAGDGTVWLAGDGVARMAPGRRPQRILRAGGWRRVDAITAGGDGRVWVIFGQPFDTDAAGPNPQAAWLPADPCLSQRQVTLRLRSRPGDPIRSAVVSIAGQPTRTFRGRSRIPVDLRGYLPGTVAVTVKVRTAHHQYTRRYAYRTC
jgi:streptogramin lyase